MEWLAATLGFLLAAALVTLGLVERHRRAATQALGQARTDADRLADDIWRLEAAAADRDRAEAANEAKGRFLATVSHEIRTPLAGIIGTADLLAGLPLDGEAASYVGAIRTSGTALGSLIDEILDFSRIEAGRLELADVAFDLNPLVEGVVELLSPRAHGKGVAIACLVGPDMPTRLRGDPARLRQILLNLAGNAIKFTQAGGVGLRVARASDGTLRFTVADTGPGIAPDRQGAIFDEFEQGDPSATRVHGGTGLGLAISRALAERMGGTLALEASSGAGSTFVLTLPPCASVDAPSKTPKPEADSTMRALLVAGAPFEATFLAERIAVAGLTVAHVEDEEAARTALSSAPFDFAIVDCALGEEAATRLAAAARAAGAKNLVLLLAPFERRALSPEVWRAFDGWLVKRVREASLRRCLDPDAAPSRVAARGATVPKRLAGRRILVAEDDDVNALIATRALERAGARVIRVGTGAAALAALADGTELPDAVVMDIRMPVLDGLAAARRLRAEPQARLNSLPLLALSANAFEDDRRAALAAGFDTFLTKPVPLDLLAQAVADCIAARARRRAA